MVVIDVTDDMVVMVVDVTDDMVVIDVTDDV